MNGNFIMWMPLGVYCSGFIGLARAFKPRRLGGRSKGLPTVVPILISLIGFNIIRINLINGVRLNLSLINSILDD